MIKTDKLIVCVAPTSNFHGKEANPALPYNPQEIAEEVYLAWNEGAAIAHIHARDKDGKQTNDPEVFQEIDQRIREKGCDIIIQHSTAPALNLDDIRAGKMVDVDAGTRSIEAHPEMASLDTGLVSVSFQGVEGPFLWTRSWIKKSARAMLEMNIKPEIEVFNTAMMEEVYELINEGLVTKPYWISFVLGMHKVNQGAVSYSPQRLMHYVDLLPEDAMFTTLGIGPDELPATTLSILLGGHVRVGFEDNIYYRKGELATSNAQLVTRIVHFGQELGRSIASPAEARALLGLPGTT